MNLAKPVVVSAVVVGAMLAASAWAWPHTPVSTPVHWNLDGVPDRWGPRSEALLSMPAVVVGLAALLAGLPAIMPANARLERSERAYAATWYAMLALLAVVHGGLLAQAVGAGIDMTRLMGVACGAVFVVIGNYLGKVRYNYVVGIRLPWTLASERVWDRTHRFAGPLMMLGGAIAALAALVAPAGPEGARQVVIALIAGTLGPVIAAGVYSWRLSRAQPAA